MSMMATTWRARALVSTKPARGSRDDTHSPVLDDGHDDFAPGVAVARDVAREPLDIRHQLSLLRRSCSAAHSSPERNRLAGHLALKRPEDELLGLARVQHIEAGPVHLTARGRERMEGVPQERGRVGGITVYSEA